MSRSKQKLKRTQKRKMNKKLKKDVRKSMNRKVVKRYNKKTIKRGKNMHGGGLISLNRGIGYLKKSKDNKSMHAHLSDVLQSHIKNEGGYKYNLKNIAKTVGGLAFLMGTRPFVSPIVLTTSIGTGSLLGMISGGLGFLGSIGFLFSRANKKDREKLLKDYIIKDMLEHNFLEEEFSDGVSLSDYVRENGTYSDTNNAPESKGYCLICTHVGRIKCEMKNWFEMAISENPISKSDLEQIEWYKPTTFKQKMYKKFTRGKKYDAGLKSYLSDKQFSDYGFQAGGHEFNRNAKMVAEKGYSLGNLVGGGDEYHLQIFGEGHSLTSESKIFPLEDALKHYLFGTDFYNNCILLERILNKDGMYYISISLLDGGNFKPKKERFARMTEKKLGYGDAKIFPSSLIISEYGVLYGERIKKVIDLDRKISAQPVKGMPVKGMPDTDPEGSALDGAWQQIVKGIKGLVNIKEDEKKKIIKDIKSVKCAISEMIHIKDKFKKLGDVPVITFCIPKSKMEKYKNQENLIVGDNEVAEVIQYRHGEALHNLKLKELSKQTGKKGGSSFNRRRTTTTKYD